MNKKEAIAYAQVTLNYMQSSKYSGVLTPLTLGIEMKQTFKLYSNDIIEAVASSQLQADKKLQLLKSGCDENGE